MQSNDDLNASTSDLRVEVDDDSVRARGAVVEARSLRKLGRLDEAGEVLSAVLRRNPGFAPAYVGLAQVLHAKGDRAAAEEALRTARAIDPADRSIALELAEYLRLARRLDEAEAVFRDLVRDHPNFAKGRFGLGQALRARGLRSEALEHFKAAVDLEPRAAGTRQVLAEALREAGQFAAAARVYQMQLESDPADAATHHSLGEMYRACGEPAEALVAFRAAARLAPDNPAHRLALSNQLRELGHYDEAIAIASALSASHPALAQPLVKVAQALKARGEHARALETLAEAVAREPGDFGAKCALAGELAQVWRLDEADALFEDVLRKRPGLVAALAGRGTVARMRGDRAQALQWFEAAARPKANSSPVAEMALEWAHQGDTSRALALLQEGLADWPGDRRLLEQLGRIARMCGDYPLAAEAFTKLVETYPRHPSGHVELARDWLQCGKPHEALASLERAFRLDPTYPAALDELAARLQASDRLDDALRVRRFAARSGHVRPTLWMAIADSEAKLGDLDKALARLDSVVAAVGRTPDIALMRVRLLTEAGLLDEAARDLEAAAEAFPHYVKIHRHRVALATSAGEWALARQLLDNPPRCSAWEADQVWRLEAELAAGRYAFDQALEFIRRAIEAEPSVASHYLFAGRMALLAFQTDEAQTLLTEFARRGRPQLEFRGQGSKPSQSFIGQLLMDWRLDAEALSETTQALRCEAPARAPALAKVVTGFRDYTGAALALMAELRRQSLLPGISDASGEDRIPRRITQFWDKQDLDADLERLCASWTLHNPGFAYRRFSLASAREYLAGRYDRSVTEAFNRARDTAQKADIFRLGWLYAEGGFYADADDRCVASLDPFGLNRDLILYQENVGSIGNNFMGVAPGNRLLLAALQEAVFAVNHGSRDILWLSTGPGLMTRIVAGWFARDIGAALSDPKAPLILDHRTLTRAVRIHCTASYKHRGKHWGRNAYGGNRSRFNAKLDELCELAGVPVVVEPK